MAQTTDVDSGGGKTGAAAGKGRTEELTGPKDGRADRANGNTLALEEPHARDSGPNASKLSDAARRRKRWKNTKHPAAGLRSLERVVRCWCGATVARRAERRRSSRRR